MSPTHPPLVLAHWRRAGASRAWQLPLGTPQPSPVQLCAKWVQTLSGSWGWTAKQSYCVFLGTALVLNWKIKCALLKLICSKCNGKTHHLVCFLIFEYLIFSYTNSWHFTKIDIWYELLFYLKSQNQTLSPYFLSDQPIGTSDQLSTGWLCLAELKPHPFLTALSSPATRHIWDFGLSSWHRTRWKQHMTKCLGIKRERHRWQKNGMLCRSQAWPNCTREARAPLYRMKTNVWS